MDKIKKDDVFCCADCGMEVVVNKACDCVDPDLACCGGPMIKKGSSSSSQIKKGSVKPASPKE